MELDYKSIGGRIKLARVKANLTQQNLAEKVGISDTHMSNIELGKAQASLKIMVNLARALSIPIDDLFNDNSNRSASQMANILINEITDCTEYELHVLSAIIKETKAALRNKDYQQAQ